MSAAMISRRRTVVGLALLVALNGCSDSSPPRLFTLAPQPSAQTGRFSGTLLVKPVDFPRYLDRPQLVRYNDPYELHVSEFERWGEGMNDMVTRVLVSDLAMRLPRAQVLASGGPLTTPADATLEINISRFDPEPNGPVVLAAQWVIRRGEKKAQVRSEEIRVDGASGSPTNLVAAMSNALGQLSDRITASLSGPPRA